MSQGNGESPDVGLSLTEAVDAVLASDVDADRETVRETLETVAEDGHVTRPGIDDALAHASKVVSTPETRIELAAIELSEAREAASADADLGAVRSRLEAFESRLARLEDRVDELGPKLQEIVDPGDNPRAVYEIAHRLRRLVAEANDAQGAADDLAMDVESFQRWLTSPAVRYRELDEDADALEDHLDDLETVLKDLDCSVGPDGHASESDDSTSALTWLDAMLRARLVSILVADLHAEVKDCRALSDRHGADEGERPAEVESRIDELDDRRAAIANRLDELAPPEWHARFDDRLDAFDASVDDVEPPVNWMAVQEAIDEHRPHPPESA